MTAPSGNPSGWQAVEEFLADIYGPSVVDQVWLAGFSDIANGASWFGMQGLSRLRNRVADPDQADLYFCTGLIRSGAANRTIGEVVAQPLLYADDIGTKVPRDRWDALFALGFPEPTFRIETSPGNETWGWVLEGDATSPERWAELALLRAYMIDRKLTDALHDATRYLRLPWGHNSKPEYKNAAGASPDVRMAEWQRGRKVSVDDIGAVLIGGPDWRNAEVPTGAMTGTQLAQMVGSGALVRSAEMTDPVVRMAEVIGLEPKPSARPGVIDALCPNMAEHGSRAETGFAFLGGELCHCNHASCEGLRSPDFVAMIQTQYEEHVSALEAMGQRSADLPLSAQHFRATASFEQHGVSFDPTDEAAQAEVAREAEELAARNAVRVAEQAEKYEQAVARLAQRFVWVGPANGFFDLEDRIVLGRDQLDMADAVKYHIPPGSSGKNRACNVIRSHADNKAVAGLTYRPGNASPVVMANTEQGVRAEHVNLWVASRVGKLVETPRAWLRIVNHILPDREYRHWFVRWLAYQIQCAGSRTPCFPLVIGGQGTGKDLMLAPFVSVLGSHNVEFVNMSRLESNFNDWQRAALVVLPELKLSADGKLYNQLKDWTGQNAGRVVINPKYGRTYSIEPVANFLGFSNHMDAVRGMEADDRRVAPYLSPAKPRGKSWYKRIATQLHSEAEAERVHWFLSSLNLSEFNPHELPEDNTGSKRAMLADNLSDRAQWVLDQLTGKGSFAGRKYLTIQELEAHAGANAPAHVRNGMTSHAIRDALQAAGCECIGQVRAGRSRVSPWFGPGMDATERKDVSTLKGTEIGDRVVADQQAHLKELQTELLG